MRVLAIDGGGIRGLIPAIVLADIEARCGRPVADLFDLIAGTSTGGIIACALGRPGADGRPALTAAEVAGIYEVEGPKIFSRSLLRRISSVEGLLDERYDDAGLNEALDRYLDDARLRDALTRVLVTAYDIERRSIFFFRSDRAVTDPAEDFSMTEAARATSGAPTYFEPVQVRPAGGRPVSTLIDGGVFALNPAMCAYAEVGGEVDVLVSLGTGSMTDPYPYRKARNWGQLEWVRPVIDIVFDGSADGVDFQLERLVDGRYVRFQTRLDGASDALDDASAENLANLRRLAEELVRDRSADLDALCARLTG